MKTLYERLSEENRQKIQEASKKFPFTIGYLIDSLNSNIAWSEMKISDVISLHDAIEQKYPFDLNRFINLFDNE